MKHKITLHLEDEELKALENLLQETPKGELKTILQQVLDRQDKKKLIQQKVNEVIAEISGFDTDEISRSKHLKTDLGMGKYHRRALKAAFQKISDQSENPKEIKVKDCENLETVNDCIHLLL